MVLHFPQTALIVLAGPAGAGKSTLARRLFLPSQIVSSDDLRAAIADDPREQDANEDAFSVLRTIVERRLRRGLLTVVDATSLTVRAREELLRLGRGQDVGVYLVVVNTPPAVCLARNAARERRVPDEVVHRHARELLSTLELAPREGFTRIDRVDGTKLDDVEVRFAASPMFTPGAGPFDLIGDIHGCFDELVALLSELGYRRGEDGLFRHPEGRLPVFLGDLADRGPRSPDVLSLVVKHVSEGLALYVPGNHCRKLARHLRGERVRPTGGLGETLKQLAALPEGERRTLTRGFLRLYDRSPPYRILDGGKLVAVHAGIERPMIGRLSRRIREYCLYGEVVLNERREPLGRDWASAYDGEALVVYGHVPSREPRVVNNTVCIDQGCVYGGRLTAFRYPERTFVHVEAKRVHQPGTLETALAPPRRAYER